ncbi:helix-turn-helix domain-containing protein [Nocardia asiatica]|uniref:helix-turn-helix domain-containing protein n=1 Tax=Nocardia asiatica TaxID=209252 RepID=UPI003EE1CF41
MAVQIPDYFPQWLTDLVLGHFPEGDPDAMRRSADGWSDAANALVPVLHRLRVASEQLAKAVEGETGAAMQEQYGKVIAHTQAQIEFNNAMAEQLYENATAIEYQQYVLVGIAGALLAQVIIDMALPPPGSIVKAIADRAEAKAGMELARRDLVLTMLGKAARFIAEHPRLVLATKGVFFGTAIGGGVPYVAQRVQMAQGHRQTVDWEKVRIGAAAGAVGGLVGVEVGRRVAPAAIRAGGRVLGTVAAGGVGGMAGGLAGGLTAYGLTGGELRGKDLAAMVWTGFGSGLAGSLGAGVRAARAGAYTGLPPQAAVPDSGLAPASAVPRISASGDAQPPQTASPERIPLTSDGVSPPQGRRPDGFGDGSVDRPDGLTPEMMAEGEQIFRDLFDQARGSERNDLARFLGGDGPGGLPDGSGGTLLPGSAPNHPSGGSSHPSSPGRGGTFPAWGDTAVARTSSAVATRPEGGSATPMPARQFQISDPQVRPDQRGITVVTEGTVTQPDILTYGTEALGDGSSPYSSPFMIQSGPDGSLYMVSPEQTAGGAQDTTAPPPAGKTLDEGATAPKEQPLLDIDAEFARMAAEFAATAEKPDAGDPVAAPDARKQAVDVTPQASDSSKPLVSPNSPKQEATPSAAFAHPAADAGNPVAETNSPRPVPDTGPSPTRPGTAATSPGTPAVPSKPGTPSSTDSGPGASNSVAHPPPAAGNPKPPGDTVGEPSAQATAGRTPSGASPLNAIPYAAPAALWGYTPDGAAAQTSPPTPPTGSPTNNLGGTPQPAATPPAPIAATGRPGTDEPDADPEEFPTPPGTIVDDPREHNVQKDPREHSVWEDPRDHSVQKKPAGDYVTVPGVSYPLEDEPPADAIPVIPRTPALTPLPVDSVGLGRAFQNPDNPDSASPRPPDITNPLSDRHVAAPETGLDAGLGKPPAAPAVPSRYATEPNPETPGAPQKPASPQLNPHSLEYQQDPSRLPAVGGVPHLQPAPQPSGKAERKRLIAQMGVGDKPRRRKKQPPPEPEPTPPPPTPDLPVPTPTPPKPRKRDQSSVPLVREELVVREAGEAIGAVGAEGERVRPAARTRQWVRSLPQKLPWLTEDQIDTAELLLSEMVANSLRWTQGKVAVIATATDTDDTRKTRFTVTDESEVVPERTGMPSWDAERGRGGEFVAMLSDANGTIVHENSKSTWFELHRPLGEEPGSSEAHPIPSGGRPGAPTAAPIPVESESAPVPSTGAHAPDTEQPGQPAVAPDNSAQESPNPVSETVRSPEEQRFVEWYRARLADDSELPGQGLAEYVEMHHLETAQVRRWLTSAGLDASSTVESTGVFPRAGDAAKTVWLSDVRRYLGVAAERMDELVSAPPGTWHAAEQGESDLHISQIRALLRRVPGARETYVDVAQYYPDLLSRFGTPIYPEGYSRIGAYTRYLRESNGLSQEQFAQRIRKSKSTVEVWERGTRLPRKKNVDTIFEELHVRSDVTFDEVAENFPHLPKSSLTLPMPATTESFGEYLRYFRRLNHLDIPAAARVFGLSADTVASYEDAVTTVDELKMLRIYDHALHRASPWNDLAEAWGYRYRMDPIAETWPNAADHQSVHDWMKAVRLHRRMSQEEFGRHIGKTRKGILKERPAAGRRSNLSENSGTNWRCRTIHSSRRCYVSIRTATHPCRAMTRIVRSGICLPPGSDPTKRS